MQNAGLIETIRQMFKSGSINGRKNNSNLQEEQFSVQGDLARGPDLLYRVKDVDFRVDQDTWIFGNLLIGTHVLVQGVVESNGTFYAQKITVKKVAKETGTKRTFARVQS